MSAGLPKVSVAQTLGEKIVALKPGRLPETTARKCEDLLIDVVGLCVTARNEDYVGSALGGCDDDGACTAIGHARTLTAAGAAFVNGTAAHGEDFDDTFEGGPVHAGAVIVPAVLAACERHNPDGRMALIGIAVGTEVLCRLSLVVPKAVHKAGFHPTAIFGAMGAAAGVGAASVSTQGRPSMRSASPAAWRAASSNISPKVPGRSGCMQAGPRNWPARSVARAIRFPRSAHRVRRHAWPFPRFRAYHAGRLRHADPRFRHGLGHRHARLQALSRGTMAQPYIDCARRLGARGFKPEDVSEIVARSPKATCIGCGIPCLQAAPAERLRR